MTKRTAKVSKRNGKSTSKAAPKKNGVSKKTIAASTKKVTLSTSEKNEIIPLAQQLRESKMALAEAQIQILRLESKRLELAEAIVRIDKELMDKAKETAVSHGIDLSDLSNRWNLDTEVGVFTRAE